MAIRNIVKSIAILVAGEEQVARLSRELDSAAEVQALGFEAALRVVETPAWAVERADRNYSVFYGETRWHSARKAAKKRYKSRF